MPPSPTFESKSAASPTAVTSETTRASRSESSAIPSSSGTDGLSAIPDHRQRAGPARRRAEQSAALIDATSPSSWDYEQEDVKLMRQLAALQSRRRYCSTPAGQRRHCRGEPVQASLRRGEEHDRRFAVRIRQGIQWFSRGQGRQGDQRQRGAARRQHRNHREFHAGSYAGQHDLDVEGAKAEMPEHCLHRQYFCCFGAGIQVHRSTGLVAAMRRSITRVGELPCDIVVSTHPSATIFDDKIRKRRHRRAGPTRLSITAQGSGRNRDEGSRGSHRRGEK